MIFLLMLFSTSAYTANVWSDRAYEISNIAFYSKQDSIYPAWRGVVQLRVIEGVTWSQETTCNTSYFAIRNEDTHLISAAMAAYSTQKSVQFYVDDTLAVEGQYCYLRALKY